MRHILSADQFSKTQTEEILSLAAQMDKQCHKGKIQKVLQDKIVACIFFEPSTRTRLSFETAALRLGAGVISAENAAANSSSYKGESIEDTARMLCCYADAIVMRHPKEGMPQAAAKVSTKPILNAGDGGNEHPSQALLDLYSIKKSLGRLHGLKVAFGFDPLHSRTIRSLAQMLTLYKNNEFIFIAPKGLHLAEDFLNGLKAKGAKVRLTDNLPEALSADIFYANRLQQERFANPSEFEANRKKFVITKQLMAKAKAKILDPLPRIDEIEPAADTLPNALYFEQAQNGLYVRMALLRYALDI
ncbi:MAG: aspartate carbamoyltransferase [Candidatus Doudnabacteria bacterium]|nr:aspartate carbamoyltransferase [Candidatus Doudnabacteria bacterium]